MSAARDQALRAAAKAEQRDGALEIDDDAAISDAGDGGAYVQAWLWVDNVDAGLCSKCGEPHQDDGGWDGMCGPCADKSESLPEVKS